MAITLEALKTLTNKVEITIDKDKFIVKFNVDKFYKLSVKYHQEANTLVEGEVKITEDEDTAFITNIKKTMIETIVEWSLVDLAGKPLGVKDTIEEIPEIVLYALYSKMVEGCSIDFLK